MKKVYLICPVRWCTPEQRAAMDTYVADLEAKGYRVHYPPRDVDQTNDDGAVRICQAHLEAILAADEVHIWFDETSYGCHFDAGMAVVLQVLCGTKLVWANGLEPRPHKSFANFLRYRIEQPEEVTWYDPATVLSQDSGEGFLHEIPRVACEDVEGLKTAYESYGPSWKSRGGVGAFMMLARKWDRMQNRLRKLARPWDIFFGIATDDRGEGLIDDVRDLRRYLCLVEAEMRARGFKKTHRDNR